MKNTAFYLFVFAFACSETKTITDKSEFLAPVKLEELKEKNLNEISGAVCSINNANLLWVHNDSENPAEIFLIDEKLNVMLTCTLQDVNNRDWEDIAVGPGPDPKKKYIYIADIGDNDAKYPFKYIYRFEEPTWNKTKDEKITITEFDRITFQLTDKRKDTETLLLEPSTKNLYIISKREEPVYLYELKYPYSTTDTLTANKLIALPLTQITGGDVSANGREILLKNYKQIFYWKTSPHTSIANILKEAPQEIPYEEEPQGEAIAWARNGNGFYTISETNAGKKTYLYFYKRK